MNASCLLGDIAHGRSGDKGNHANIAIIAYTPAGYAWLLENLSADAVRDYFLSMTPSRVSRYEAANVLGLNFVAFMTSMAGGMPADRCALIRKAKPWHSLFCKDPWIGRRIIRKCCASLRDTNPKRKRGSSLSEA